MGPRRADPAAATALIPTTCFNCEACCGLVAYVDKTTGEIAKLEGNPHHPASRGRNCAKGPATLNQVYDPERILYPLKRAGRAGEGRVGAHRRGTRRSSRDRRAHRHGVPGGPPRRGACTTSAGPATTATSSGCSTRGASTATTATPTSAPPARGSATRPGWASTGPSPDHANATVIFLISVPPGGGSLLQPPRPAHHRGARCAAPRSSASIPACPTLRRWPTTGWRCGPARRPFLLPRSCPPALGERHLGPRVRAALGQLGHVPERDPAGPRRARSRTCVPRCSTSTPTTRRRRRQRVCGVEARTDTRDRGAHRPSRSRTALIPQLAGIRRRATRVAGRRRGACCC